MGKCRACAEVMEDLHFLLRRSSRHLVLGGDMLRKKMAKDTADDFFSRRHILREMGELCQEMESIHPPSVVEDLVEMCETLTEDYADDIIDAFIKRAHGHQL